MSKTMQNVIIVFGEKRGEWYCPERAGSLIMNRFSIDEDAEFEIVGVFFLADYSQDPEEHYKDTIQNYVLFNKGIIVIFI